MMLDENLLSDIICRNEEPDEPRHDFISLEINNLNRKSAIELKVK